jgi:hypothetical protein
MREQGGEHSGADARREQAFDEIFHGVFSEGGQLRRWRSAFIRS